MLRRAIFGRVLLGLMVSAGCASRAVGESETTVYESKYTDPASLAPWAVQKSYPPTAETFLGPFAQELQTFSLKELPPHQFLHLKAQLVLLSPQVNDGGANAVAIVLGDGRTLLSSSFELRNPAKQSYPDAIGERLFDSRTGITQENVKWAPRVLAGVAADNAVVDLDITFPHTEGDVQIMFEGRSAREGWGFGKVTLATRADSPVKLDVAKTAALLKNLEESADAARMNEALWTLISGGDAAVDLISKATTDIPDAPAARALIARLNDESFEQREAAQRKLIEMGPIVAPICREALAAHPDDEVAARLQDILNKTAGTSTVRDRRLARVLHVIGTPKAVALAQTMVSATALPDLDSLRTTMTVVDDNEWRVISPKIAQVLTALKDPTIEGTMAQRRGALAALPEMKQLQEILKPPSRDVELKQALNALRTRGRTSNAPAPADPQARDRLQNARNDLMKLLTIRQEAILVSLGVLE